MQYEVFKIKEVAKAVNDRVYSDYFYRLMLIARSLFEWKNLPNGIDEKWIERYLFTEGNCLFFDDPNLGYMVTKIADSGPVNVYDEPTLVTPVATNYVYTGKEPLSNNKNCVIIRNNDIMLPTAPTIQLYAYDLTNIKRTIDTNIIAQKMPIIVRCSDKQRLTLKNVINQKNDNEPVIFGDKTLDLNQIEVLKTEAPIVFDKLQIQKHEVWNECMTFLGINNANMNKRERLVTDEVEANDEQIKASEDVMLKARKKACEQINKIFGLNVSVERRRLKTPFIEESEVSEKIKEGGSDDVR